MRKLVLIACSLAVSAFAADTRIADAAERHDAKAVRALIAARAPVNAAQVDGTTALHWAAEQQDDALVADLLRAGASASATNRYQQTPLGIACANGNGAIVAALLQAGADAKAVPPNGESLLMTASRGGSIEAVRALIAHGTDVNYKEPRTGQTALMWAAAEGHNEITGALIKAGADFKTRLNSGFDPLLFAAREGHIGVARTLIEVGADVNAAVPPSSAKRIEQGRGAPRVGMTPLIMATINGHFELAAYLLDAGADPNAIGPCYTALHAITVVRKPGVGDNDPAPYGSGNLSSLDMVRKLASSGADLNARMTRRLNLGLTGLNNAGATPFVLAARGGDTEMMRLLVALGADPLIPTNDGATPLIVAAGLGTRSPGEDAGTEPEAMEAVKLAIELGNDVNAVDKNGETVMHAAAYKNSPGVVELLAASGAKIEIWNTKNKYGWTPLTIAEGKRFGNFKPSPPTVAAIRKVMATAGVEPPETALAGQ